MGFLLKIILFGIVIYTVWKTVARWKGHYDRFVGRPPEEPARPASPSSSSPAASPPPARKVIVEDTVQCIGCGAYISSAADQCGHCGRPRR